MATQIEVLLSQIRDRTNADSATSGDIAVVQGQLSTISTNTSGKATESTLAAVLAKLIANPATEATLASLLAKFTGTHTLTSTLATTSGSIAAGSYSVAFSTSTDFVGTINGISRAGDTYVGVTADVGKTISTAIPYTITAGSITIDRLV